MILILAFIGDFNGYSAIFREGMGANEPETSVAATMVFHVPPAASSRKVTGGKEPWA